MEVVQKVEDVAALDEHVHLFCPRNGADDGSLHYDEDLLISDPEFLTNETRTDEEHRKSLLKEVETRTELVLDACTILAFDGDDAKPFQNKLKEALSKQLSRCDVCVREFHRARSKLKATLEGQYGADEVQSFMDTFDDMNKLRIKAGLDNATQLLLSLPPEKRSINSAGSEGMYALFEALNCLPLLDDEEIMQSSFDKPFQLCQSRKKIKLPNYPPGMVAFLYSTNEERSAWAYRTFAGVKRSLTSQEFDNSVKPFLERALNRVHISFLDEAFLPTFWRAMRLILSKSYGKIVAEQLRAMDANLWTTGLEHFQIDKPHFDDLMESYKMLLERSPLEFWNAMGVITPQAILDTIFQAPQLDKSMMDETKTTAQLVQGFSWLYPFLGSLKADNLIPPVRTILDHMLDRFQKDQYTGYARTAAFETAMTLLHYTLLTMREKAVRGPVVVNMLELIAKDYLSSVLSALDGVEAKDEMRITPNEDKCLQILESLLSHDCRSLIADRLSILQTKNVDHDYSPAREALWKRSIETVKPGHPVVAASIASGISGLLTMEPLAKRQIEAASKPSEKWNTAVTSRQKMTGDLFLERLQSLSVDNLAELVQDQHATVGIFALLFSGVPRIHEAALDVLKTLSSEDSRRESMMYMLRNHFRTTLTGTAGAMQMIARSRTLAPCINLLKLCTDIYSCLCDDADGILRSDRTRYADDLADLEAYWQMSWASLNVIFEQTEAWSQLGHDKTMLQDFCRATMDFADSIFDQYSLLSSCLRGKSEDPSNSIRKRLLEKPRSIFANATKWLRLRDDYLITKAVQLTCKMLSRFHQVTLVLPPESGAVIEGVLTGKVKTKLTMNQKAQLQRALETSTGQSFSVGDSVMPIKQESAKSASKNGTLDMQAWSIQAAKEKDRLSHDPSVKNKASTGSVTVNQQLKAKEAAQLKSQASRQIPLSRLQNDDKKMNDFRLKRQREKEEADKRRAEALAKAKGLGAGSGVVGLGDIGKDHTLKGQNVMVSSDEDSEDDDEDDFDEGLFGPQTKKDKKLRRPEIDTHGVVGLKPEQKRGPTKIQRTVRSFKDMRARLAPDLQPLHRNILKWDFFHDGTYPPGSSEHQFRGVSNVFNDPSTYQGTFQPLLTLEAWQGMVKAREENSSKAYDIKVASRSNVDSFLEITSSVSHAENRELQLSEGDIILLSLSKTPADSPESPHCLARIYRIKRQKAHLETVYQLMPGTGLDRHVTLQSSVYGLKIQSIIPLEREYGALQALQYYDLCNQIVRAKPSPRLQTGEKQVTAFQDIWNVNRAQSEAINAALVNEGFSLIQGPPGSGKTKTIVAIVGGLLSDTLASSSRTTRITVPGQATSAENSGAAKKLLVCAPSNAAVDELVMRLKEGVKTRSGKHHTLNVVRIGRSDAINQQVLDVTMDELVAKRLGTTNIGDSMRNQNQEVFKQHERISAELKMLYERRDSGELKGKEASDLLDAISSVRRRKQELGTKIDNVKDQERNAGREAELNRKKAQQAVLDQAHVICATLSGSGHDMFQSLNIEFETVIIDEAAQCVEMSSLIPLKYGCVKCIMVGDPKQLPPTVFSKEAAQFQYEQSLFVRMQNNFPKEVYLLDTQYRMHPDISIFPSRTFYDGLLKDGKGMAGLRERPWHVSSLLAPYRFFDVRGQHQSAPKGHSLINLAEIDVALALFSRVRSDFGRYDFKGKIGIITPYKSQLRALKDRFSTRFGNDIFDTIEFNTTDAFQGRESEIIIFSCVRASPAGGIGFLQDIRRMNVGLTRAKSSLWVLGNSESLVRGQYWKKLVEDAQARDSYTTGDILQLLARPSSAFSTNAQRDASMHDVSAHTTQMHDSRQQERKHQEHKAQNGAQQQSNDTSGDRMEGVRYRFEDRIKNKRSAPDLTDDNKHARSRQSSATADNSDVEMKDAGSDAKPKPVPKPAVKTFTRPPVDPFIRPKKRAPR